MSLLLVFRSVAQNEFDEAADWYERQQAGLGTIFIAEVRRAIALIVANPDRYPVAEADVRVTLVRRFPYAIYYRLKKSRIVVVAVFHTARDPQSWSSR